jgi:hypothetical protein
MVHETPSPSLFFKEVADMLKAGGRMLVVEPRFHVNKSMFAETVEAGQNAGLTVIEVSKNMGGRRVLFGN